MYSRGSMTLPAIPPVRRLLPSPPEISEASNEMASKGGASSAAWQPIDMLGQICYVMVQVSYRAYMAIWRGGATCRSRSLPP